MEVLAFVIGVGIFVGWVVLQIEVGIERRKLKRKLGEEYVKKYEVELPDWQIWLPIVIGILTTFAFAWWIGSS